MMSKVLVLLSTYNGEKFLKEQLDSILSQKHVDVYLLIRDDGSRDATRDIIKEYVEQNKNVEWLSGDCGCGIPRLHAHHGAIVVFLFFAEE